MNINANTTTVGKRGSMTDHEAKDRRASIQAIMKDPSLTPQARRKSVQSLMDGRRRSSTAQPNGCRASLGMDMAAAAAMAAADFVDSSDEDEDEDEKLDSVNVGQKIGSPDNDNSNNKSQSKKRSSFSFKRGSSHNIGNEKSGNKRRSSLRASFTMGFSKIGVKNPITNDTNNTQSSQPSICLPAADPNALSRKLEKSRPPCGHYERNCSIVSPCCGMVFGCRICHDDSPVLPPPFLMMGGQHEQQQSSLANGTTGALHSMNGAADVPSLCSPVAAASANPNTNTPPSLSHRSASLPGNFTEEESHHEIDRFMVKEIICRECYTRQSSKANNCNNCGIQFGTHHCATCNLWMSADEDPYHCLKCGFCRVGGRENFTHCDDCGMCIDALLFEDHNCKSGKYMSNCPVCQEDLFSSRMASHEMPCGHAIHWHCFRELTSHDTRCPVCKRTAETHDQMEQTWSAMAMGIALQPVPAEMARVVDILCNDCDGKGTNQRWHFLGVQCERCTSFNTTVERTVLVGQEATDCLGPPSDVDDQALWVTSGENQNVLTALMGGGTTGLPNNRGEDINEEEVNQSVAAEVMGIMNRNNQPFPRLDEGGGRDQS